MLWQADAIAATSRSGHFHCWNLKGFGIRVLRLLDFYGLALWGLRAKGLGKT